MESIELTFVDHAEYSLYKAHFDRLYRLGNVFVEKVKNCYLGRMYWVQGKRLYTEVSFTVDNSLTRSEQYQVVDELLDTERDEFFKLYDQAHVGCGSIKQL